MKKRKKKTETEKEKIRNKRKNKRRKKKKLKKIQKKKNKKTKNKTKKKRNKKKKKKKRKTKKRTDTVYVLGILTSTSRLMRSVFCNVFGEFSRIFEADSLMTGSCRTPEAVSSEEARFCSVPAPTARSARPDSTAASSSAN